MEKEKVEKPDLEAKQQWPEEEQNFFIRWSYSYMTSLLAKGSRQTLLHDDLWNIPPHLHAPKLLKNFSSLPQFPLWKKLSLIASPCFVPAGVFQLVTVICQCALPMIGRQVIRLLENPSNNLIRNGMLYGFLMFMIAIINGIATQRYLFLGLQAGMMVRTTVVSAIYATALQLSPQGKLHLKSGEVMNLASVDAQKVS